MSKRDTRSSLPKGVLTWADSLREMKKAWATKAKPAKKKLRRRTGGR